MIETDRLISAAPVTPQEEALERTAIQVATAVIAALSGRRPEHLVNPQVWERRRLPTAA